MGFPSPATDYAEQRISLDHRIIIRPVAPYFMRAGSTHPCATLHQQYAFTGMLIISETNRPNRFLIDLLVL